MTILAIDPGPFRSAWVAFGPGTGVKAFANAVPNDELLAMLRGRLARDFTTVVIEKIESYGMPVGAEVFETVYASGRFAEAVRPTPVQRIGRGLVKRYLCGTERAKDTNVRHALLDRYGGSRQAAIGTKAEPGPLYGVSGDVWAALAVAIAWSRA